MDVRRIILKGEEGGVEFSPQPSAQSSLPPPIDAFKITTHFNDKVSARRLEHLWTLKRRVWLLECVEIMVTVTTHAKSLGLQSNPTISSSRKWNYSLCRIILNDNA